MTIYEAYCVLNKDISYRSISDITLFKKYAKSFLGGYGDLSDAEIKNTIKEIYFKNRLGGYICFSEYLENAKKQLCISHFIIIEHSRGLGTAVIKDIVEQYKTEYDIIYCFVDVKNDRAIKFYKKVGKVYPSSITNSKNERLVVFYEQ